MSSYTALKIIAMLHRIAGTLLLIFGAIVLIGLMENSGAASELSAKVGAIWTVICGLAALPMFGFAELLQLFHSQRTMYADSEC